MDRRTRRLALRFGVLALAGFIYLADQWIDRSPNGQEPSGSRQSEARSGTTLEQAYSRRLSNVVLQVEGKVDRILDDDNDGSRHQRFIIKASSGTTVLVAHNIDLAERVPLERGDQVVIRGEYEWNDRGGVLHWTHHDPQGRRPGGWIRHRGREYR
jgi:hypothetical protein